MSDPVTSRLVVRAAGEVWSAPSRTGFVSEAALQHLLAEQPSLVPGVTVHALAATEFATGVGPSDVVIVDTDGSLTLVECKLASNEEIRRKVVGQVLDYASRLWRMRLEDFDEQWVRRTGESLLDRLDDGAREALRQALDEGSLTLVLAVDRINDDLRRIVEYLNAHTGDTIRILAMELDRAEHGGVELLIPTTYGAEIADARSRAVSKAGSSRWARPQWRPDDVLTWLRERDPSVADGLADLLRALQRSGLDVEGTRAAKPSLIVFADVPGGQVWPYSVYTGDRVGGSFAVNYDWLRPLPEVEREAFLKATSAVLPTIDASGVLAAGFRKRPGVPLAVIADPGVRAGLVAAAMRLLPGK